MQGSRSGRGSRIIEKQQYNCISRLSRRSSVITRQTSVVFKASYKVFYSNIEINRGGTIYNIDPQQ